MSDTALLRDDLRELVKALTECREFDFADLVESAATGSDSKLLSFLSGELWGGAGSVPDQAGFREGARTDERRKIETILIRIAKRQMQAGIVNGRATHLI
jgi:hypothetical protein